MARGGFGRRGRQQRGKLSIPRAQKEAKLSIPRAQKEAVASAKTFRSNTPPEICLDINRVKWIPDTGSSLSRESTDTRTIDLYWHMKSLLEKEMAGSNMVNSNMLLQMEYLWLQIKALDLKISFVEERAAGLNFNEPSEGTQQEEQLEVILELREQVSDLHFREDIINRRIDALFGSLSSELTHSCCPVCGQPLPPTFGTDGL